MRSPVKYAPPLLGSVRLRHRVRHGDVPRSTSRQGAVIEWKWVDALTRLLELCGVRSGDVVSILFDETTDNDLLESTRLAADRSHVQITTLGTRAWQTHEGPLANPAVAAALGASAFVIDLTGIGLTSDTGVDDVTNAGARILSLGHGSVDELAWFAPHPGLSSRLGEALHLLERATVLRTASHGDHVLEVSMREVSASTNPGTLDRDTEIARFPGGSLTVTPGADAVSGSIALMPGDINVSAASFIRSPVVLVIERDRVCDILGGGADADLVRSQFEAIAEPDMYGFGAVTIGMNRPSPDAAGFDQALLSPDRAWLSGGHCTMRFGTNSIAGRTVAGDVVFTLRRASVTTDQDRIVIDGELLGDLAPDIYERASFA